MLVFLFSTTITSLANARLIPPLLNTRSPSAPDLIYLSYPVIRQPVPFGCSPISHKSKRTPGTVDTLSLQCPRRAHPCLRQLQPTPNPSKYGQPSQPHLPPSPIATKPLLVIPYELVRGSEPALTPLERQRRVRACVLDPAQRREATVIQAAVLDP